MFLQDDVHEQKLRGNNCTLLQERRFTFPYRNWLTHWENLSFLFFLISSPTDSNTNIISNLQLRVGWKTLAASVSKLQHPSELKHNLPGRCCGLGGAHSKESRCFGLARFSELTACQTREVSADSILKIWG